MIDSQQITQLVLPVHFRSVVLKLLHDDSGHHGRDRTTSLVRSRFFWPGLESNIEKKVKGCDRCVLSKANPGPSAELVNIVSTQPMELVCIDFLTLQRSKGGFEKILVITDHFARYAQAFPTRNELAKTTAKVLFENFIVHYVFSARLHRDQGRNFESSVIQELWGMVWWKGSTKLFSTCLARCKIIKRRTGRVTWPCRSTPIMPPNTPVRPIPHMFSCLGDIRGWQSMHI